MLLWVPKQPHQSAQLKASYDRFFFLQFFLESSNYSSFLTSLALSQPFFNLFFQSTNFISPIPSPFLLTTGQFNFSPSNTFTIIKLFSYNSLSKTLCVLWSIEILRLYRSAQVRLSSATRWSSKTISIPFTEAHRSYQCCWRDRSHSHFASRLICLSLSI